MELTEVSQGLYNHTGTKFAPNATTKDDVILEPLTPEERALHARGIVRIRRQLFRRYQPADYFIVSNSENIIAASAEACWNAACGDYRVFRFGGLSYIVDCRDADGLTRFNVSHTEGNRFHFWLTAARGHTMTSLIVRFHELDEVVHEHVCSYRRMNMRLRDATRPMRDR